VGGCGLDASNSGQVTVARSCENSNEPSGSLKGEVFIDQLNDYQLP